MKRRQFIKAASGLLVPAAMMASTPLPTGFFKPSSASSIPANLYSGLIHAYMFNEGSGSTVPDRIGGKDLTLQNSPTWGTQSGMTCITLNGSNQYLDTAAWTAGSTDVSMVGWFYFGTAVTSSQMMLIEKEPVNGRWALLFNFSYELRGASGTPLNSGTSPSVNTWHQLAGTITGSTGKIYVDGADTTAAGSTTAFTDANTVMNVGRYTSGFFFNGKVGPIYIYNRALSAAEMAQLYAAVYLY